MNEIDQKLKPCPCCAEKVSCDAAFQNGYGTYYSIKCTCGISISGQFEEDVMQRWNQRVVLD
ncbi:MAG: hypothetical protein V7731_03270 [Amphritea sp.]